MKEGWEYKKLKEVASVVADGDWIESRHQSDSGIRLIQTGNIGNGVFKAKEDKPHFISEETFKELGCTEIFSGDCLVSRLPEPVGRACIIPNVGCRMITAVDCTILRFKSNFLPEWFVYYTRSKQYQREIDNNTTGTTRKRISRKNLESVNVPVPPLAEQERIVAELDLLSGIIDKQKAQLKELDILAQSIFYDMFGDAFINDKKWETQTIGALADFYNGKAHEQVITEDGRFVLVNSKLIATQGEVAKHTDSLLFPLKTNDIVMVMSDVPNGRALAKCMLIDKDNHYTLNQRICAFRRYELEPLFLLHTLNRNKYFLAFDNGKSQTNLRRNEVEGCPVIIPPLEMQTKYAEKIQCLEKQKETINQSIVESQKLFDYTMDKYFS